MTAEVFEEDVPTVVTASPMNLAPPLCVLDECRLVASLLDETPQGILVVDEDGIISYANLAMSVFFLPFHVVVGERLSDVGGLESIAKLVDEVVERRSRVETDLHLASVEPGRDRCFHAAAAPWKEEGRQGVWIMVQDMTERLQTEQSRQEFITHAGHELRTPLSLIHGYIETLRGGMLKNPAALQRCLEVMDKHSRRMMRIIDDLLTLARLEGGDAQMKIEPFLVRGCVEDVLEHLMPLVESRQPVVTLNFPADGGLLHGDRFYWDQIFSHLIEHSLNDNPRSGLRLQISGRWDHNECILTVADDGVGIRAEDVPLIFQRFHCCSQEQAPAMKGAGLGMCIVRHAVEAHGGSIEVESRPGVSTVFTMRVPLPG